MTEPNNYCITDNRSTLRRHRLTFAIVAGLLVSAGAAAQQQAADDRQPQRTVLEEVIVTATKKERSVAEVPATVNVVTGEQLTEFKIFQFEDVEKLSPGLELSAVSERNWSVTLRGAPFDPDSSAAATVVTYWNEIPILPNVAFQQLFDIQRIEVLRGTQGTLQGETSPSGSIQIHTGRADVDTTNGYLRQTVIDDGGAVSEFAVGTPLIDGKVGARVSGVLNKDLMEAESVISGEESSSRTKAGRINLFAIPTSALDVSLTYEYLEKDADALTTMEGSTELTNGNPPLDTFDRHSLQDGRTQLFQRHELVNLTANYEFAGHTLTLVSGYQDIIQTSKQDLDAGNIFPDEVYGQTVWTNYERFNHELRLTNNDPGFWEYLVGLYYNDNDTGTVVHQRDMAIFTYAPGAVGPQPGAPGFEELGDVQTRTVVPVATESIAAFFNNDFHFTDALTVTAGIRWQDNKQTRSLTTFAREDINFGAFTVPEGTVLASLPERFEESTDEAVTGVVKVAYDLTSELMIYGSYGRSFRPGGVIIEPNPAVDPELVVYDEETSDNLEIGFKQASDDGRYQLTGAVYYQKFDGFINRATLPPADLDGDGTMESNLAGINFNADAVIRGAELEGRVLLTPNWQVFASASYNDAKYDGAAVPCGDVGDQSDPNSQIRTCRSDGRLGRSPLWNAAITSEYTFPGLVFGSDAYIRALYRYTGERVDDFASVNAALYDEFRLDDYGVWDLYLGVISPDGNWEISAWVTNLTDEEARLSIGAEAVDSGVNTVSGNSETLQSGYSGVRVIPGRLVGVTGTWRFEGL